MRKKKFKLGKKLKATFWIVAFMAALWVALAPHHHRAYVPHSVTVPVQQPKSPEEQAAREPDTDIVLPGSGDENAPQEQSVLPYESATVPVEKEKIGPAPHGLAARIAIVIDDVGPDLKNSERAITLPPSVTLSFLPYAVRLREQAKEAADKGHELMLHMPMEPLGRENPGPGALLVELLLEDSQDRLVTALSSFTGFDGINNHMGSKFTTNVAGMEMVMDELKQRQLFFLDSRTNAQSIGKKVAEAKGVPTISRDVFIDDDQSPVAIRRQLELTERIARRKGVAVAIGHPHPATLDALTVWMDDAARRGVKFVPIKTLVKGK